MVTKDTHVEALKSCSGLVMVHPQALSSLAQSVLWSYVTFLVTGCCLKEYTAFSYISLSLL